MRTLLLVACTFSALISVTIGFRNGAPRMVCDTMEPSSHVHGPAQDNLANPLPYNVSCFQSNDNDNQIIVEVDGATEEDRFKGILLEIRNGQDGKKKLGKFDVPVDNNFQLQCRGDIAVTHGNSADKESARFTAVLNSEELSSDPHCVVTIVKVQKVHWDRLAFPVKLRSDFQVEESVEEINTASSSSTANGGQEGIAEADGSSTFDTSSFVDAGRFSFGSFANFLDLRRK